MSSLRTRFLRNIASACLILSATPAVGDFSRDIQPLLAEHCYACHGPDAQTRKSGLRFDLREGAIRELKSGSRAIVPGDLDESEMMHRIFSEDPDEMMPPPEFRKSLSNEDRIKLRNWVRDGAEYEQHWSFRTVEKPKVPALNRGDWARNPIDHFILSRLESEKMEPSPEASPETLIRRISLDLRGLPPSLNELRHFVRSLEVPLA